MRISRISVQNFRNFADFEVDLAGHTVIVGENRVGKSNLLHALRLLLDPTLRDAERYLRLEDFWDGLPRPLTAEDRIEVSTDLVEFDDREDLVALLADYFVATDPLTARLTYRFQPLPELGRPPATEADYEFVMFGGNRSDQIVPPWVRRRLPLVVLEALRDAERDLESWRRSPLRPLLESAIGGVPTAELDAMAAGVQAATEAVAEHSEMEGLAGRVNTRLEEMIGEGSGLLLALGFSPTTAERLLRALRLFVDDRLRSVGEASLGTANLIYLALKTLELQQLAEDNRQNYVILAIEEPEAHLHPHLQRLVYRDFLRGRGEEATHGALEALQERFVVLTTHSPHIVSVTPIESLVLLKRSSDGNSTVGVSTAGLEFSDTEVADLERYLDVTRGELLFAKGVLLVEGMAEAFIVPKFAKLLGYDLDQSGVSVCVVGGANFAPYRRLLGSSGLDLPHAIATDLDPILEGTPLGLRRAHHLLEVADDELPDVSDEEAVRALAENQAIFVGSHTLEMDILKTGATNEICDTLAELAESTAATERAAAWREDPDTIQAEDLLKDIRRIGKGRFAQRLAERVQAEHCPEYIRKAIEDVVGRLS